MTLRKTKAALPRQAGGLAAALDPSKRAERLVGIGFRCWLAGYETQDINCWETGWNLFARELGACHAKAAVTELTCWVRAVHIKTCRRISTYPFGCSRFCHDAASQHSACPAMRACAFALLGTSDINSVVETAASFGDALCDTGYVLSDRAICDASMLSAIETPHGMHEKH